VPEDEDHCLAGFTPGSGPVRHLFDGFCRLRLSELELDVVSEGCGLGGLIGGVVKTGKDFVEVDGIALDDCSPFRVREGESSTGLPDVADNEFRIFRELGERIVGFNEVGMEESAVEEAVNFPWEFGLIESPALIRCRFCVIFSLTDWSNRGIPILCIRLIRVGLLLDLLSTVTGIGDLLVVSIEHRDVGLKGCFVGS
jgi:hypothetical protein